MPDAIAVVLEGPGPRILGLSARERNRRVLQRAGVPARDGTAGGAVADATPAAVTIPATVVITPGCVPHLSSSLAAGSLLSISALPPGLAFDVSTAWSRREASRALLRATAKPTDGWVATHLNRPVSRQFSRLLLAFGCAPGHATLLAVAAGAAAAAFAARPSWPALLAGAGLFQLASILDGVDGEMARATLSESPAGARIDAAVDIGTYLACFAAFVVGWVRGGVRTWEAWTAGLAAGVLLAALWQAGRFVRRHAPDASFVFVDRAVEDAARNRGGWAFRAVRVAFLAMRRDAFTLAFLALALTGRRSLAFVAVAGFAVVALLTFRFARDELAAAAARLRDAPPVEGSQLWRAPQPGDPSPAAGPPPLSYH